MNDAAIRANQEAAEERRHTEVIAALKRIEALLRSVIHVGGAGDPQ